MYTRHSGLSADVHHSSSANTLTHHYWSSVKHTKHNDLSQCTLWNDQINAFVNVQFYSLILCCKPFINVCCEIIDDPLTEEKVIHKVDNRTGLVSLTIAIMLGWTIFYKIWQIHVQHIFCCYILFCCHLCRRCCCWWWWQCIRYSPWVGGPFGAWLAWSALRRLWLLYTYIIPATHRTVRHTSATAIKATVDVDISPETKLEIQHWFWKFTNGSDQLRSLSMFFNDIRSQ